MEFKTYKTLEFAQLIKFNNFINNEPCNMSFNENGISLSVIDKLATIICSAQIYKSSFLTFNGSGNFGVSMGLLNAFFCYNKYQVINFNKTNNISIIEAIENNKINKITLSDISLNNEIYKIESEFDYKIKMKTNDLLNVLKFYDNYSDNMIIECCEDNLRFYSHTISEIEHKFINSHDFEIVSNIKDKINMTIRPCVLKKIVKNIPFKQIELCLNKKDNFIVLNIDIESFGNVKICVNCNTIH